MIIPAFGTEVGTRKQLEAKGCILVDTTCGDDDERRENAYGSRVRR